MRQFMRKTSQLGILAMLYLCCASRTQAQNPVLRIPRLDSGRWVEQTLEQLSVEEKIGQMLQVRIYGDYHDFNDPAYRSVADQIQKYHIGSVDLAARMSG